MVSGRVILADFWGLQIFPKGPSLWNNKNKSCLNDSKFWEVSENSKTSKYRNISWGTQKSAKTPHSGQYWSLGQDDLVLSWILGRFISIHKNAFWNVTGNRFMLVISNTLFFLNDLFIYLAIDTVFHPSGIIQNGRRKLLQNHMFKVLITWFVAVGSSRKFWCIKKTNFNQAD